MKSVMRPWTDESTAPAVDDVVVYRDLPHVVEGVDRCANRYSLLRLVDCGSSELKKTVVSAVGMDLKPLPRLISFPTNTASDTWRASVGCLVDVFVESRERYVPALVTRVNDDLSFWLADLSALDESVRSLDELYARRDFVQPRRPARLGERPEVLPFGTHAATAPHLVALLQRHASWQIGGVETFGEEKLVGRAVCYRAPLLNSQEQLWRRAIIVSRFVLEDYGACFLKVQEILSGGQQWIPVVPCACDKKGSHEDPPGQEATVCFWMSAHCLEDEDEEEEEEEEKELKELQDRFKTLERFNTLERKLKALESAFKERKEPGTDWGMYLLVMVFLLALGYLVLWISFNSLSNRLTAHGDRFSALDTAMERLEPLALACDPAVSFVHAVSAFAARHTPLLNFALGSGLSGLGWVLVRRYF